VSLFRIGGLASGINFNEIVDQLMALERRPVKLMEDKKQILSWKKDFWSEIQNALSAVDKSSRTLLQKSAMLARSASSTDQNIVAATATSDAAISTYTVDVLSLATSTRLVSGLGESGVGISGKIDPDAPISSYTSKLHTNPTAGTFTVNGIVFSLSDTDSDSRIDKIEVKNSDGSEIYNFTRAGGITLNDIVDVFNYDDGMGTSVSAATGVTAAYNSVTDKFSLTATSVGGDLNLGSGGDTSNLLNAVGLLTAERVGDTRESVSHLGRVRTTQILADANFATAISADENGNGKFSINGVEITYNINTDTLKNVIDRINSSNAGVNATYDSMQDRLVLTNKNTGSTSVSRSDVTGNFLAATSLLDEATETLGSNARFTISGINDGNVITSLSNDVSGVVAGVTFNLKKEGQADITIGQDNTKAKEAIKNFVDRYNAALTLINTRLSEEKARNPKTLIEKRQGLLRADRILTEIRSKLANKTTSTVSGLPATLDQLAEIGITITKDDFGKSGRLELDEAKLEAKLNDNAAAVANLFFNDKNGDGKIDAGEDGVASRIANYMDQLIKKGSVDTVTRFEDDSTGIQYTGNWSSIADGGASGGTVKQSSTIGDSASFTFTGSSITWYATKDSSQGIAEVWIDGVKKADVDLYSNTVENKQAVFSIQGLSYGTHTVEIKVTSNKNDGSSGYSVNIDAIDSTFTSSTGIIPMRQDVLQGEIGHLNKTIEAMETRLTKREETLIKKFIAMEDSLARLQKMGNWFQTQLAGMFGGSS